MRHSDESAGRRDSSPVLNAPRGGNQINRAVKRVEGIESGVEDDARPDWETKTSAASGLKRSGEAKPASDCGVGTPSLTLL